MANEFDNRNTHIIEDSNVGSVQIADEVVSVIATLAAMEVEGVDSIADTQANELKNKFVSKSAPKGVKITVVDSSVSCDIALNLKFGHKIPELAAQVQDRVKTSIENMTGFSVIDVNVRIAGIKTA